MRITQFSDIGLRTLIYLSRCEERVQPVTMAEIAKQFDLPANHLVKVASHLSRVGWLESTRGRNGGIRLAASAMKLKVGTILRELEGDSELVDCDSRACQLSSSCILRKALANGLRAFYAAMNHYSLADLTADGAGEQIVRMHRSFIRDIELAES